MIEIKDTTTIIIEKFKSIYLAVIQNIPEIIFASIIVAIFLIMSRYIRKVARRIAKKHTNDALVAQFLGNIVATGVIILGIVIAFNILGLTGAASEILAGIGITGFIVGFAFKDIAENFIAGLLLAFKRPYEMGDIIDTNGITGSVIRLTIRETTIKTFDGKDVYVPNGLILKAPLKNYSTDNLLRHDFVVGLDYDDDIDKAIDLIYEAINAIEPIKNAPKAPMVFTEEFSPNSVNIRIHYWLNMNHSGLKVKSTAMNSVLKTLNSNGFYIPTNIVEYKNYRGIPKVLN
jgi:small-conductance mechanosensitive channel